jgi:hypothetical protein
LLQVSHKIHFCFVQLINVHNRGYLSLVWNKYLWDDQSNKVLICCYAYTCLHLPGVFLTMNVSISSDK